MIFNKLKLKNFKSHENTFIEFKPCVNLIIGENGAGKSTILEAISFALFKQYTTKKIIELVRTNKNKNPKEEMEVSLEFNVNGKDYKIIRKVVKTQSNDIFNVKSNVKLLIRENKEYYALASGDKQVNNEIQSILNMDSDLFLNAVYIRQGEIADLIKKTPSAKKKLIGKLLGIESLEKAWDNLLPIINKYENKKSELKGKISSASELSKNLENKKIILNNLNNKANSFEKKLNSLKHEQKELLNEKNTMESEKTIFEALTNNLVNEKENIKKILEDKITFKEQLKSIEAMEKKMSLILVDSKKLPLYLDFEDSIKNIKILKKEKKILQDKLSSIIDCKSTLKKEESTHNEYIEIEEKLNQLNQEKAKYDSEIQINKKIFKDKQNLELEISKNQNKIIKFFEKTNKIFQQDFNDFKLLSVYILKLKKNIKNKLLNIDEDISIKNQEKSALKEGIKGSKKPLSELNNVKDKCPVCKSNITNEKKEDLIISYKKLIEENENSIKDIDSNIKKLKLEKKILSLKLIDIEKIEIEISSYSSMNELIEKNKIKVKELENSLKSNEELNLQCDGLISKINYLIKRRKITKNSYDNYIKSQGLLTSLGDEYEVKDEICKIIRIIDNEIEKIKNIMEQDTGLSTDIGEKELKEKIQFLKYQDQQYNQLKGSTSQKSTLETQLKSKSDEFNWKKSKIKKIQKDIEICQYDEKRHEKILRDCKKIESRIFELNKNISEIKGKTNEILLFIEELNLKLSENKKYKENFDNVNDFLKLLKEIRKLYSKDGVQRDLRNKSRPLIQSNTIKFFEQFNFNYSDLKIDEDYNVFVFSPEGETNLDMISGGERIAIALALRLGITQSISSDNLETILLDEPTIHLDNYRRIELIELLTNISIIPQMIIVTHDTELENAAGNIIKVIKNEGISKISSFED